MASSLCRSEAPGDKIELVDGEAKNIFETSRHGGDILGIMHRCEVGVEEGVVVVEDTLSRMGSPEPSEGPNLHNCWRKIAMGWDLHWLDSNLRFLTARRNEVHE